jgi:cell division septal protein FtsQ
MEKNKGEEFLPQSRIALAKGEDRRKNRRLMYPLCALFAFVVNFSFFVVIVHLSIFSLIKVIVTRNKFKEVRR